MSPSTAESQITNLILPPSDGSTWAPPLDLNDLAVRLEADGVTESVARSRYGLPDVWSLAELYLSEAQTQRAVEAGGPSQTRAFTDYLKGLAFAAPLIACCLVVLFAKVSLWGGNVSGNEAAAIAIATVSSFVVTGGFIQIISRLGHFYKETRQWSLCAQCCTSFVRLGLLALVFCIAIGFLANAYYRWLPMRLFAWCAAFHFSIGAYLLTGGVLYVLDGEFLLTLGTLLGTAAVLFLHLKLRQPLLASQISGVSAAAVFSVLFAVWRFRRVRIRTAQTPSLPSRSQLVYVLWPFFAYGCLYYLFLFVDRLIAWSAHTETSILPLQFRGAYETALDVCLFAFIVQVGWIRAALVRFYRVVMAEQQRCRLNLRSELRKVLLKFYKRQLLVFFCLFVFSTLPVIIGIAEIPRLKAILLVRVALLMLLGTPLLTIGLWNTALLFALSRPSYVLMTLCGALACNVCVGYLLSRLFSYDLAILGFDLGACALAIVSAWFCSRLLDNFDYHFFAATK